MREATVTTLDDLVDYFESRVDDLRNLSGAQGEDSGVVEGRLKAARDVAEYARYLDEDGFSLTEAFTILMEHTVSRRDYALMEIGKLVLDGGFTDTKKGAVLEYKRVASDLSRLSLKARRKR